MRLFPSSHVATSLAGWSSIRLAPVLFAVSMIAPVAAAEAQRPRPPVEVPAPYPPPRRAVFLDGPDTTRRSGPRFGAVYLGGTLTDTATARSKRSVRSVVTFFGWDYQHEIGRNPGGAQPVTDLLFGVGGLEQGVALPSASLVIGLRLPNELEFGVGPNVSGAGPALVLTAGMTHRMGTINVPIDVAVVPSSIGTRVSLTTGFNVAR